MKVRLFLLTNLAGGADNVEYEQFVIHVAWLRCRAARK
jgi:hypothetical protein